MSEYIVSARKYRPQVFDDVVGQKHVTETLKNAVNQKKLAQSLLFCGPRGVGKTTTARILAREINNFKIDDKVHFNIVELDAASNNSVDDIRQLTEQVRYPPQNGKYKVYIIDEVHMLTTAAFNAFLKTLEEPPPYAIFILATTEKHKILPTILSRCQTYDFSRISISDINQQLQIIAENESIDVEKEALVVIAEKADGALRDACSIFDQMVTCVNGEKLTYNHVLENLHILDYDYFFKIITYLLDSDSSNTIKLFNEIINQGFNPHQFLAGLMNHLRDLFVCKDPSTINLLEKTTQIQNKYLNQSQKCTKGFLLTCLDIANKFDSTYKNTDNKKLHIELAIIKMAHIKNAVSLFQEIKNSEISTEEKKKKTYQVKTNQNNNTTTQKIQPLPKVPSIDEVKKNINAETETTKQSVNQQPTQSEKQSTEKKEKIEYNQKNVDIIWSEIIKNENKENQLNNNTFLNGCHLEIIDKKTINVFLVNTVVQQPKFETIKNKLSKELKSSFDIESITYNFKETKTTTQNKSINSIEEKKKILIEKEPKIKDLFNDLDLTLQ